ncbi:SDR family NAD(P)-dependent oxidoreductase [Actinocorallia aurantiaca]|uniref:Short subunit dehydrogenase n=1 Tax=Actinocorallia aurantiaca TaxID=46204 RepID=A0ABN3UBJ8_9ACTN
MRNYLITGGTDGIGRAVALDALAAGHRVVVVGGTAAKGEAFLRAAGDAADRAAFVRADLRLIAENRRVLAEALERFDRLDRLVLCAQRYRTRLTRTAEGLEENFALSCLSRHVLGAGLAPLLREAADPLVASVCGTGTAAGRLHWDDLQFTRGGRGLRALLQAARATDLVGVDFAANHPDIPYVLFNPDMVRTNLQRDLDQPWRAVAALALALRGKPVAEGIVPLLELLERPPSEPLSAYRGRRRIPVTEGRLSRFYDPADAERLREQAAGLLAANPA